MRTTVLSFVLILATSSAWASNVVIVSISGKDMGVKTEDFQSVNAKIGSLVSNFKLESFKIVAYGIEGGYQACLTPVPRVNSSYVKNEMASVLIDASETFYSVEEKAACK